MPTLKKIINNLSIIFIYCVPHVWYSTDCEKSNNANSYSPLSLFFFYYTQLNALLLAKYFEIKDKSYSRTKITINK